MTFLELARKVLKEEEKPLTVEEIWEIAQKNDYEVATKGKTPWRTIGAQIYVNIRESFFQAVSNSSWANEGYLVAPKMSQDEEFMFELKRLSTSFGIGIIKIDIEDPDSSKILFPAKFKTELDWDTINKLAGENIDFKEFITRIKNDLSSKEVIKEKYDQVYDAEKLKEMLKQ